jgi:competence protein ComEC
MFSVLSPGIDSPQGGNNQSCVLRIDNGAYSILLTADIELATERWLIATPSLLRADFLLVPHHGSKTSSSEEFLKAVGAGQAILSVGYASRYGHPHQDVMNRYAEANIGVVSTADSGSILLKINNINWSLTEYRSEDAAFWMSQKKPI